MAMPSCRCHPSRLCCTAPSRSMSSLARSLCLDFCALGGSYHAGSEVDSATKNITFLHIHRPDMNAGTNLDTGGTRSSEGREHSRGRSRLSGKRLRRNYHGFSIYFYIQFSDFGNGLEISISCNQNLCTICHCNSGNQNIKSINRNLQHQKPAHDFT